MDISIKELEEKFKKEKNINIIDVREPYEYEEYNIGGELIPLGDLTNKIEDLEYDKDEEIIVYCKTGQRSAMAKEIMKAAGYSNVRNLLGGVKAWQEAKDNS